MGVNDLNVRNLRLVLEYDGTEFCGWQKQPKVRTVEGELLGSLAPLVGHETEIIAAARTDSGVHALGQVASFASLTPLEPDEIGRALNSALAQDLRIISASEVPLAFNARYDAKWRRYRYLVATRPTAVWRRHRWHVRWRLDIGAMRQAAQAMTGEHDFSAFTSKDEDRSPWIRMDDITVEEIEPDVVAMEFRANRFLRKMVRTLVGTLVEIGRGKMQPQTACDILSSRDGRLAGPCAPPHGLYLVEVAY
ncbi:MAG TPA: tRNA pseudouridine(38-40) synthase TruA [bacterium]|nr:tRNA pseudouridine(38-40) synthase TruA [bacterium]